MTNDHHKLLRVYTNQALSLETPCQLTPDQGHYLKNVMRKKSGDVIRSFNGKDGEWLCSIRILNKQGAEIAPIQQIRSQPSVHRAVTLLFPPLAKNRMDFLIEKAVELGVSSLHPILTQNTEIRKIRDERLHAQIIEAAEQCERLSIPALKPLTPLLDTVPVYSNTAVLVCLERSEGKKLANLDGQDDKDITILIGPPGGFTKDEAQNLKRFPFVKTITLGNDILRTETAALYVLSVVKSIVSAD